MADYARHNHTIDDTVACVIFGMFGQTILGRPKDVLSARFAELKDGAPGKEYVDLNVLCFCADKR